MRILYVDTLSLAELAELQRLFKQELTFQVVDERTIRLVGEAGQAQAILTCCHPICCQSASMKFKLTRRQYDVLSLLAAGRRNKEIGQTLGIAVKTVESHVSAILRALKLKSRTGLAGYLAELGWFGLERSGQAGHR